MAKIRNNYEKSWFPRLLKWLDGGSGLLDDAMAHELDEGSEEHLLPDSQDALTRETKFEQHRQESLTRTRRCTSATINGRTRAARSC